MGRMEKSPIPTTIMPPQEQGFYVPEDVVHLIFKEIMSQGDRASFRTAALLSSTFLYVAQLHLYRSFKLTIGDPTSIRDITTLLDIIERRPYVGTFIKVFSITDLPHPEKKTVPQGHAAGREKNCISLQAHYYQRHYHQNFLEVFTLNTQNLLPRLCCVLFSLSTLNLSFQRSRLNWHALHDDVKHAFEGLFGLGHLVTAQLGGIVNLPSSIPSDLFALSEIELNDCHFASPSHFMFPGNRKPTDIARKNYVRRLCIDTGHGRSNFEHVVWDWWQRQAIIPAVEVVCLSLSGWHGAWDVAVVLATLGRCINELSLSTTQLELAFIQEQPPKNPFYYPSVRLPRINSHAVGECFATDECDHATTTPVQHTQSDHPSWFLQLMSPLRPRFHPRSFEMLHKLKFEVSHWRSAMETNTNGELFWVINWLAELPLETVENIRELSIFVHVGTDFCLDNASALTELAGYQGWGVLDLIVAHPNWRSLEKVIITIRSRTTCLCEVEEKIRVLMEWLKESMLPLLNARGVVDVVYISLESTLPS